MPCAPSSGKSQFRSFSVIHIQAAKFNTTPQFWKPGAPGDRSPCAPQTQNLKNPVFHNKQSKVLISVKSPYPQQIPNFKTHSQIKNPAPSIPHKPQACKASSKLVITSIYDTLYIPGQHTGTPSKNSS